MICRDFSDNSYRPRVFVLIWHLRSGYCQDLRRKSSIDGMSVQISLITTVSRWSLPGAFSTVYIVNRPPKFTPYRWLHGSTPYDLRWRCTDAGENRSRFRARGRPPFPERQLHASFDRCRRSGLVASVRALVRFDRDWIPSAEGASLYLRPFMIGTEVALGATHNSVENTKNISEKMPLIMYLIHRPCG